MLDRIERSIVRAAYDCRQRLRILPSVPERLPAGATMTRLYQMFSVSR